MGVKTFFRHYLLSVAKVFSLGAPQNLLPYERCVKKYPNSGGWSLVRKTTQGSFDTFPNFTVFKTEA